MGIIAPKKRIELAHKKWLKEIERTTLIPKVSKRNNGKKRVKAGSKPTEIKSNTCLNFTLYLQGNSIIIETIPYTASKGVKGSKKALPYIKWIVGVISQGCFERSSTIDVPHLAKCLGLTPRELLKRCQNFAERHCNHHTVNPDYKKTFTNQGIVRLIKKV